MATVYDPKKPILMIHESGEESIRARTFRIDLQHDPALFYHAYSFDEALELCTDFTQVWHLGLVRTPREYLSFQSA